MNWQEILMIIAPIITFMGWVYNRIDKKIDGLKFELKEDIKDLRKDVQAIESRVSHIEGQLVRMNPYEARWHPHVKERDKRK